MLHKLELLSHLIAFLNTLLELLAYVHNDLACTFELLSGVVSRA